jgi:Ca2+-binding EF-hand superfamily protein
MRKWFVGAMAFMLIFGACVSPSFAAKKSKKSGADAAFKKLDSNGDGKISLAEFKAGQKKKSKGKKGKGKDKDVTAAFRKLDKNKDGFLSLSEFKKSEGKKKKK